VSKPLSEAQAIVDLARAAVESYIADPVAGERDRTNALALVPTSVVPDLDALLAEVTSYRDALLVALAVPLVRRVQVDLTERTTGARSASGTIGRVLAGLHIKAVGDAYQNIAKNSTLLARGNNPAFDRVLRWASSGATLEVIDHAYRYVATSIAATARNVEPLPQLRPARLTFPAVMGVLDDMLRTPSGGVHEQYILAACLHAGVGPGYRVETKMVTTSDTSSQTPGDIQVISQIATEALEVTANEWDTKLPQARSVLERHDFQRVHIVGHVPEDLYRRLPGLVDADISVLDVRATVAALVALLPRQRREAALSRLYELLDRNVPSPNLVNAYVLRLQARGLAE
jgi:hypothetical protein